MEKKTTTHLTAKREALRLWFEYLRIARSSTDRKVRGALTVHSPFYARWEMDKGEKFDTWWKSHSHLFEEKFIVRKLEAGQTPLDPDALVIEVPLTQSPSVLTKNVKTIIQAAFDARQKENRKSKRKPTASFHLTDGSEPKLDAVREMLSVYRDVYLKNPNLRGEKLLDAAHKYYTVRKNKRWAKIPMALIGDDKIRAMRNLRRYIQKAEKVVLNEASGQFPGIY